MSKRRPEEGSVPVSRRKDFKGAVEVDPPLNASSAEPKEPATGFSNTDITGAHQRGTKLVKFVQEEACREGSREQEKRNARQDV